MKQKFLRERAAEYRRSGYSYNIISRKLGLSKSTLSDWLRDISFTPNNIVLRRVKRAQLKSARFKNKQRIANIEEMKKMAIKEIGRLRKRDLLFLGIGLYLGEGTKLNEQITFINADKEIIRIALKWFKGVCGLGNKNIIPRIHLYPDVSTSKAIDYWSRITCLPRKQFAKTQIDRRINKLKKKRHKLLFGTLHLRIKSYGKKEFGRSLHRRIMGWIEAISGQI